MRRTLVTGLMLCALVSGPATLAQDTTVSSAAATNRTHKITVDFSPDVIPQEILDKLTPDQIYDLYTLRLTKGIPDSDDVPPLALGIVAIVFGCPVLIVMVIMIFRHRRRAMVHRTLAAMIEKGVPIPPELLAPEQTRRPSDLRRGIVLVAAGIGFIAMLLLQKESAWSVGFIPLLIGLGYLLVWKLDQRGQAG